MKQFLLSILSVIVLFSCSLNGPEDTRMVAVSFDFTLSETGSMTRSGNVYDTFYDLFIKSCQLLPSPYSLQILTLDGKEVATISGVWNRNQPVMLATGKYRVTGTSSGNGSDYYKTAVLVFDEEVEITESTTSVTLHAEYDCFLLLFDAEGKSYFSWTADGRSTDDKTHGDVPKVSDFYYIFAQGFKESGNIKWNYDGKENRVWMSDFNFQKGCYYYFNDIAGRFEIPKMNPGSL